MQLDYFLRAKRNAGKVTMSAFNDDKQLRGFYRSMSANLSLS